MKCGMQVGKKKQKIWVWLAIDCHTKEIVGAYIGDRSELGAKGLWDSLPPVDRQCAVTYTDFCASSSSRSSRYLRNNSHDIIESK